MSILTLTLLFPCACQSDHYEGVAPSPDRPWIPPDLASLPTTRFAETVGEGTASLQQNRDYSLPELIDFAESNHPETRVAWEQAKEAAAKLGIAKSAYSPTLTLSAAAGFEHVFFPFPVIPKTDLNDGFITSNFVYAGPGLQLNWLLFDFGRRSADEDAARQQVLIANVGFNAAHQRVVFNVTRAYYAFIDARQRVEVATAEVEADRTVEGAVDARRQRGLATNLEVLQARRQTIQAAYDYEGTMAQESDARVALAEAIGVLPTTKFGVASLTYEVPTEEVQETVDQAIDRAMAQRPDLAAKLAGVREKEAEVRLANANFNPIVKVTGNVSAPYQKMNVENAPYFNAFAPIYGAAIELEFPLFDGGERSQKLLGARAALRAADEELLLARDAAVREVWKTYTDARLALRRKPVADALLAASQEAYTAAVDSYTQGVGNFLQVTEAQQNLTAAHAVMQDTQTAIYTSIAALSLATGEIAKPR
jgi:outer membrane protein TolC